MWWSVSLIAALVALNACLLASWWKARTNRHVPRLPRSLDTQRTTGPAGLVFQVEAGSGFGDRVGYYLGACALGRCWDMDVYARWINPEAHGMGTAPLDLVLYPDRLHFDRPIPYWEMERWLVVPNFRDLRFNGRPWNAGYDLVPELQ